MKHHQIAGHEKRRVTGLLYRFHARLLFLSANKFTYLKPEWSSGPRIQEYILNFRMYFQYPYFVAPKCSDKALTFLCPHLHPAERNRKMQFNQKAFGERVRNARKSCGFTQEALANSLNTSREFITRIETGKNVCSFELLINIAELLNCSTDYLLLGKESGRENLQDELRQISIQLSSFANRLWLWPTASLIVTR